MAGFLIIEGDVDEAINLALTGSRNPDPQLKTGPYDYIERTMLIQRLFSINQDPDAPTQTLKRLDLPEVAQDPDAPGHAQRPRRERLSGSEWRHGIPRPSRCGPAPSNGGGC